MIATIKKSLTVQNKRTRKLICEFANIIDTFFFNNYQLGANWVPTGCQLSYILVPTWCHHEQFMSTYIQKYENKVVCKLETFVPIRLYQIKRRG